MAAFRWVMLPGIGAAGCGAIVIAGCVNTGAEIFGGILRWKPSMMHGPIGEPKRCRARQNRYCGTMERVLGIGGFFFAAKNKAQIAAWYETHLGIPPLPATYDDPNWRQQGGSTLIHPYDYGAEEFGHPDKTWHLNFRVRDLGAMVAQLRAAGIAVEVDETIYPNGQFAHLSDPEGNQIELWQPAGLEATREEVPAP